MSSQFDGFGWRHGVMRAGVLFMAGLLVACGQPSGQTPATPTATPEPGSGQAIEAAADQRPPYIKIDDIADTLLPVAFQETPIGLKATPKESAPVGHLAFWLPKGTVAATYRNFAHFVAGKGYAVSVLNGDATLADLDTEHVTDACTVLGTIGDRGQQLIDYGMERRDSVDGLIITAFAFDDPTLDYKKKLPIAVILGGQDRVRPPTTKDEQVLQWPSQTYFLTLREANHAGYFDGGEFAGDGVALVPPDQQRLILGEISARMTGRFCLTREKVNADGAKRDD